MSKFLKKAIASTLSLLFLVTSITACGGGSDSSNTEETASNSSAVAQETQQEQKKTKFDEPVTMTTVKNVAPDLKFKQGESIENNVLDKIILDELGIKMEYLWTTSTQDALHEKMRLALASGQQMPDIAYITDKSLLAQLMESDMFLEVSDVYDEYAGSTWKSAMDKYPQAWLGVSSNGKKIGIPSLQWMHNGDTVLWMREDWMKKLNLSAPTTMDDFEKVLDAFVNNDPDGNGKKDTYGLALALKATPTTWMGSMDWITGAYGSIPGYWTVQSDGKLLPGELLPGYKEGVGKLQSWIQKEYLPKDSGLYDEMKASELFISGKAGVMPGAYWCSVWPLQDLKKNFPDSEIKAYMVPTGPDGKAGYHSDSPATGGATLISKDFKTPEAAIMYLNWFYENYANPQPGSKYEYGLAEGYDWANIDGKPTNDKNVLGDKFFDIVRYSVTVAIIGTALSIFVTILTAYPLSKNSRYFKGRNVIIWFFLLTMLFNGGLIPNYILISKLGLMGSIWALILPGIVSVWNTILLMNFYRTIPKELEEAALIDGAGHFRILFNIYLPLSTPSIAALTLFCIVGHWNSWFDGMIYSTKNTQYPLATYLQSVIVQNDLAAMKNDIEALKNFSERTVKAAQIFICSVPILLVYPLLQKYFVTGMVLGAVKE